MLLTIKEILIGLKVTCIATLFIIVYETILKFDFGTKKLLKTGRIPKVLILCPNYAMK